MLANLKIENVAVIEKAEVNFTPGFNVRQVPVSPS